MIQDLSEEQAKQSILDRRNSARYNLFEYLDCRVLIEGEEYQIIDIGYGGMKIPASLIHGKSYPVLIEIQDVKFETYITCRHSERFYSGASFVATEKPKVLFHLAKILGFMELGYSARELDQNILKGITLPTTIVMASDGPILFSVHLSDGQIHRSEIVFFTSDSYPFRMIYEKASTVKFYKELDIEDNLRKTDYNKVACFLAGVSQILKLNEKNNLEHLMWKKYIPEFLKASINSI